MGGKVKEAGRRDQKIEGRENRKGKKGRKNGEEGVDEGKKKGGGEEKHKWHVRVKVGGKGKRGEEKNQRN